MSLEISPADTHAEVDPQAVRRKVARRLLPLVFCLYIVSYLDRANVGFAKLQMQESLGFPEKVFGRGFGIFFVGYLLLEIPGALLVQHWSARKWFTRILITWGACSMAMALVRSPTEFYSARFLLGLAESGFFPGVIIYFTHWFPRAERGRALAGMVLAIPVGLALGAKVSGAVMQVHWFGLQGWQWVFIIEGLPSVLLGLCLPWIMTDRPRNARWLEPAEREWLEQTLEKERQETAVLGGVRLSQALKRPTVWLLALGILVTNTGGYALVFWLPTAVANLRTATGRVGGATAALDWMVVLYLFGLAGVWLSGQSSDRTGERKWHCVGAQVLTGVFLAASIVPGQPWGAVFFWLCLTEFFAFAWPSPFWVLPTLTLSSSAAAVSIGFINICANIAGILGSPIIGEMKDAGFSERACLLFLAGCYAAGGAVVALLRVPKRAPAAE
ncbi:MAG: MFS transporter [Isosphaeraceae bacterium]|nr:MFS transporter [Isosphaeraceae bacterium]